MGCLPQQGGSAETKVTWFFWSSLSSSSFVLENAGKVKEEEENKNEGEEGKGGGIHNLQKQIRVFTPLYSA